MNAAQLRRVTVESFAHYRQGLVELLLDSVKQGASIGFLADVDAHEANSFLDEVKNRIAINDLVLWVVVRDEQVLASAQLVFCKRVNGLNRAEVQKLMVRSDAQRRGMGQQLMEAVEVAARQ